MQVERQAHFLKHVAIVVDARFVDTDCHSDAALGQSIERRNSAAQAQIRAGAVAHTSVRLGEEIRVLYAEVESLNARKAAASTRDAVGDRTIAGSGFSKAQERIQEIRSSVREQNKLLQYYEYERVVHVDTAEAMAMEAPTDAVTAIDEALAAYPAR